MKAGLNMMVQFDLEIYSFDAIQQASHDFASIATIEIDVNGPVCTCTISHSAYDQELTCDEFSNYVLELSVSQESPYP